MGDDVEQLLREHGVPIELWGRGAAKSVADLRQEIERGEAVVGINPRNDRLERLVRVAEVDVLARGPRGRKRRLVEDHQRFADGRTRRRKLDRSLAEKLVAGERPLAAARRALREELGVVEATVQRAGRPHTRTTDSPSYPGLRTRYELVPFIAWLPEDTVRERYVEKTPEKATTFRWAVA
jgi:hypothetical protein